jgi:hypothetical protein
MVPVLPSAIHRNDAAHGRKEARRKAVRHDTVHVIPAPASRTNTAAAPRTRADAHCAAPPSWRARRCRSAEEILRAVPGIELVDLQQPAVGLQANNLRVLPQYRRTLQEQELLAAEAAGIDALVAVYHSDHRELCAHERDWPFRIINFLEIVGASMGLHHDDHFKRLKMLQDVDAILADCRGLVERHGLDVETMRQTIRAMLDEQPVPLRGAT